MPASSSTQAADSSAEIKATGIKNKIAARMKKKGNSVPKRAVVGKFLMLSMAPVISSTRAIVDIFSLGFIDSFPRLLK